MSRMKTKTKRWIGAIALVLVAVALCAVLGNLSDGFQKGPSEWKLREVNPDNLYQTMDFADTDGVINDGVNGVTVKLGDDNVIKVNGNSGADQAISIGTVTLKANTAYVFSSSMGSTSSKQTMYLSLNNTAGNELWAAYTTSVVIPATAITTDMIVTLTLNIAEDVDVDNVSLRPVICVGESADDLIGFYK